MKEIDLTGKCGSCFYFHKIAGKANGECHRFPYGDDVVHDPEHPFFQPTRSRLKCKEYRTKPLTNADRIRAMTDEELAVQLELPYLASPPWCSEHITCPYISEDPTPCDKCALDWLKQEAQCTSG